MAIILNDNIKINAGKPSESKYLNSSNAPYASVAAANAAVPISERYLGLTVLVDTGTSNVEYWWREGVADVNLIEKKFASEQLVGDFITGATNLGYFSGLTGIQWLNLSGGGFGADAGLYYSEYNWYYADGDGVIRIGMPTHNGPLRRAYVNSTRTKSWIWDVGTSRWIISQNDVVAEVGNLTNPSTPYTGSGFTNVDWWEAGGPSYYNGSVLVTRYGSIYTGDTATVGNAIYSYTANQDLNFRTIINDTPEFIKIESDDYYIRFSGATSALVGQNVGAGTYNVFTGKTGSTMFFRTLTPSGDTTITQKSDGSLVIYSSSDGSANALTGATNVGSGVGFYSGTTDRNMQFRTIIGTGNTTVTASGDTIIVDSTGSLGQFTSDIVVSIASGKTFGKYLNGDVIPASGKTANEVILMSLAEALEPTLTLGSSATNVLFGESGKTVNVTFSYTINTIGASVSTAVLEWRRDNTGAWSGLTSDTGDTNYFHTIDDSADRFNTDVINYRYTVVDSAGGSGQTTYTVTPQAYTPPTFIPDYDASTLESYESENLREIGNVDTLIGGSISSNRSLVNLIEYRIQRDDGGGYVTVATVSSINALTTAITPYLDNGATTSATSIKYRIQVDDEYTTSTSSEHTITLRWASFFGYSTLSVLNSAQIVALGNEALLTSLVRTVSNVTAPASNYTYIAYPESFGDISSIIMDGATPIQNPTSGAFDNTLSDVTVTNYYGENKLYRIYKSNAVAAFTNNELAIS